MVGSCTYKDDRKVSAGWLKRQPWGSLCSTPEGPAGALTDPKGEQVRKECAVYMYGIDTDL